MDAIRHYPVCVRDGDDEVPQLLYYECEMPGEGTGSYTRSDHRISGGRDFKLRTVYRGVVTREEQDVFDKD